MSRRAPGPGFFSGSPSVSDFDPWQMKKEIGSASVIAITRHVKEGNRLRAVVSEIVLRKPGTDFSYKIGDEIERAGRILKEGVDYGDGEIVFFTGPQATMGSSWTVSRDRIVATDMSLETFHEMVRTNGVARKQ